MIRKILATIAVFAVFFVVISTVSAKSLRDIYLRSNYDTQVITKYGTEAKFHTSVLAKSMNADAISVETTVQRKNSLGNWQNRGRALPYVTTLNEGYESNFNLGTTADTRAIWVNVTPGTTLFGDVYINNGYA